MRKRLLLRCVFLAFLGAVIAFVCRAPVPNHRINEEAYKELRLGMTLQEVEKVLGVPPGDYGPGEGEILGYAFTMTSHSIRSDPNGKKWLAGEFAITVCFDDQGRARGMGTDQVYRPYDSFWEMLCQKLGVKQRKPHPFIYFKF